jgi:hypothetical protein
LRICRRIAINADSVLKECHSNVFPRRISVTYRDWYERKVGEIKREDIEKKKNALILSLTIPTAIPPTSVTFFVRGERYK